MRTRPLPRLFLALFVGCIALAAGLAIAGLLVGGLPAVGGPRADRLRDALHRGDLQRAEQQLARAYRAPWRRETEALVRRHGAPRVVVSSGYRGPFRLGFERRETIYRLAFADGAERCLWVRGRGAGGLLAPVGAGYFDCATIPAPSSHRAVR